LKIADLKDLVKFLLVGNKPVCVCKTKKPLKAAENKPYKFTVLFKKSLFILIKLIT